MNSAITALPEETVESLHKEPSGSLANIIPDHVAEGTSPAEAAITLDSLTTLQSNDVFMNVMNGFDSLSGG